MEQYKTAPFILPDGSLDLTTGPVRDTEVFLRHGFITDGSEQFLDGGIHIYPKEVFCPWNNDIAAVEKTKNTATIHWYTGSWLSEKEQQEVQRYREYMRKRRIKERVKRIIGENGYHAAQKCWSIIKGSKR